MAIFQLKHTPIGRTTHRAGTAGARLAYIGRRSAAAAIITNGIPENPISAKDWMNQQERRERKNARMADGFIIALPIELNPKQQWELGLNFARAASGNGKIPFYCALHTSEQDADNPHIHLVIRDRHIVTGKRVMNTSEKGSTRRFRALWEVIANKHLEMAGLDVRIDRRSKAEQAKDHANDNEPDMNALYEDDFPAPKSTADTVERLKELNADIADMETHLDTLERLEVQVPSLDKQVVQLRKDLDATQAKITVKAGNLAKIEIEARPYIDASGNPTGFSLFGLKSTRRRTSEALLLQRNSAKVELEDVRNRLEMLRIKYDTTFKQWDEALHAKSQYEKAMGSKQEQREAYRVMLINANWHARHLSDDRLEQALRNGEITEDQYIKAHEIRDRMYDNKANDRSY